MSNTPLTLILAATLALASLGCAPAPGTSLGINGATHPIESGKKPPAPPSGPTHPVEPRKPAR